MIYILLSVVLSSLLVILFKVFNKYQINVSYAIVANYFTASLCGMIASYDAFIKFEFIKEPWFPYTALFGLMFISVFKIIAWGVEKTGITPVSVAQKMSLIIPVGFTIWYYHEHLGGYKLAGILVALTAIVLASLKKQADDNQKRNNLLMLFIPAVIFIGSGLVDVSIKITQEQYGQATDISLLLSIIFGTAGIIGIFTLFFEKGKADWRSLPGGIALGLFNFSSTWFIMKALALDHIESSVVFAINNIGVIIFSAFIARLFFREKITTINWLGIGLSVIAIILISVS